jgi:hypothetical protein
MAWETPAGVEPQSRDPAYGGVVSARPAASLVAVLLLVAACDGGADPTAVQAQSSITVQTTTDSGPGTVQGQTTVTTTPAPTPSTTTTTTVAEPKFVVITAGGGVYRNEQPLGPVYGDVRPEAVVTVNGVHADVSYVGDTVFGEQMWRWHLGDEITLKEGENEVVFEATFADGSTLSEVRTYRYDPNLQQYGGYVLGLTLAIPPRITLEFAPLEYGELGLEQAHGDTEIAEIAIATGAVFVVLGGFAEDLVLDLEGFAQLAAKASSEELLPDQWWDSLFPTTDRDGNLKAAPWEFLLTSGGQLQQAAQLYSP